MKGYVNQDIVNHFAELINDLPKQKSDIFVFGKEIFKTVKEFELEKLLPDNIKIKAAPSIIKGKEEQKIIDKIFQFLQNEKSILTVKKEWLDVKDGNNITLQELIDKGSADIRIVDDILGAMVVASRKRRNKVLYLIDGYEDELLITAAGLAKAKTVGFRNFFVYQNHYNTPAVITAISEKDENSAFLVPLKTGLNTGIEKYTQIPLLYRKSVVISGYEAMEIMQSIYMLAEQSVSGKPAASFQRTKELSEEVVRRANWMIEEVFTISDCDIADSGHVKNGKYIIKDKYRMFDGTILNNFEQS